jgi:hypothetical protein
MYFKLTFNNLVEIPSYPQVFFYLFDFIIEEISLVEKVLKTKEEEG